MSLNTIAAQRRHAHAFDSGNAPAERGARRAMWLTVLMMVVEIGGGG